MPKSQGRRSGRPAVGLVRAMPAKVVKAGLALRTVVVEFESVAAATAALPSATFGLSRERAELGGKRMC